ncbi:MAG: hypothetical protein E7359_03305 [Clostridiales bacterium]|nr:hypothetical protein [Clostridiales bacterium]
MEKINVEKLKELGIFEIRNIAREVGVYSPTTIKKETLIEKITNIVNGIEKPYVKKTKQGRPPKSINSINQLMDVIVPSKIFENTPKNLNECYFNDLNESIDVNIVGTNETYFKALIKTYDNLDYALAFIKLYKEDKENVVFINKSQVQFYKLKSGDEITGKYLFLDSEKPLILKEIYSINEVAFTENFSRNIDFSNLPALFSKDKLKLNIYKENDEIFNFVDILNPLAKGQRILFLNKNDNFLSFKILNRLSSSENNLKGLAVLIDEVPENYFELSNIKDKVEILSNNYSKGENLKLEIEVKFEKLLRQVENGEDVVLFINDISKLYNYLLNLFVLEKNTIETSSIYAYDYIKKLVLSGKFTGNGSLTIISNANFENYKNNFENRFSGIFNNVISYTKKGFDYFLDYENSYTSNLDKILTKPEIVKYKELINKVKI